MISACMIVKNEQACIEDCLKSIKGIDEIVILDTGSTDRTPAICRRYTNKVFVGEYAWQDHFAQARNEALKRCTGDWIFSIDADERLMTGVESLKMAIRNAQGESVLLVKIISGSVTFWYPRIFRSGITWRGAIHECPSQTGNKKTGVVIECGSSENHATDPDRALRILKREVTMWPDCVREKYYLAREFYYRRDFDMAIFWFKSYLEKSSWPPERADSWCLMAKCFYQAGEYDKAKDACLQAVKINADFAEPMYMMAAMSYPKNRMRWLRMAESCRNEDVLFVRKIDPAGILQ